jgi:hypothetical protein
MIFISSCVKFQFFTIDHDQLIVFLEKQDMSRFSFAINVDYHHFGHKEDAPIFLN